MIFPCRVVLTAFILSLIMQHLAGQILVVAAIVLGAYIAFIGVVVFTLHVIDWVKDWRTKWRATK